MAEPPFLVVQPAVVGRRLGLHTLTPIQHDYIVDAIIDAQDAVEGELGRPLQPSLAVVGPLYPRAGAYDLDSPKSWPLESFEDTVQITGRTVLPTGGYQLDLLVGLDGRTERPIVRYVTAHAEANLRESPTAGIGRRVITSLSAEGQSVSYAAAPNGDGVAGAVPTLKDLRAYKRHAVGKANRAQRAPWPYDGSPVGYHL